MNKLLINYQYKAIFIDRDGTLIKNGKDHCAWTPQEVELIPGAREALYKAKYELGYLLYLFTNQSAIGKGLINHEDVYWVNQEMLKQLDLPRHTFNHIYIASETPKELEKDIEYYKGNWNKIFIQRKPSPYCINDAVNTDKLDRSKTWIVGDNKSDIEAGFNGNINQAAVLTGHLTNEKIEILKERGLTPPVFPDLLSFVNYLESKKSELDAP